MVMLPTIMLIEGGKTFHSIIGFEEFGGGDGSDFGTDAVEQCLVRFGMINGTDMFAADQHDEEK